MPVARDQEATDAPSAAEGAVDAPGWELEPLLAGRDPQQWLDDAEELAAKLTTARGTIAELSAAELAELLRTFAELREMIGRAGNYVALRFALDTGDEAAGAAMQRVEERATAIANQLVFFELEWAALDDDHVERLLESPELSFCGHWLRASRRFRPHLLSEAEERLLADKQITGASAWARLFSEQIAAVEVSLPDDAGGETTVPLEGAFAELQHPGRARRARAAEAITAALRPGLRTRAFILNTLVADKASTDRHRGHDHWLASRNLENEATDASVAALVEAVVDRYDLARRWYRAKAEILGLDRLADFDRSASVSGSERTVEWSEARRLVEETYAGFSGELGGLVAQFFDERWIDAPLRPGKQPGAFCAYTVPSHHPYVLLNWTGRTSDVLTLAHELGHGVHACLSRPRGVFHHSTPLTVAETASVFGETLTFRRLLAETGDAEERLALAAKAVEGSIGTVFRQVAMNRFEDVVHTTRRAEGELAVERICELWAQTQQDLFGDAVEVTPGYRSWWSYVPHFVHAPGYVYAYAFGQLFALSVYRRYEERGDAFVPRYLELLAAGGSLPPAELGRLVDCDLEDPAFWDAGLDLIEVQIDEAEAAARATGRLR